MGVSIECSIPCDPRDVHLRDIACTQQMLSATHGHCDGGQRNGISGTGYTSGAGWNELWYLPC